MSQNKRKKYKKDKYIWLKRQMKIQNKYVFRTINISIFSKKKTHGSSVVAKSRRGVSIVARPNAFRFGIDSRLKALGSSIGSNLMYKVDHIAET